MDGPTCSMDPWIGSESGICLSGVDRSKWYPWMVLPVPWIHGLDRTVGYACLVWTGASGVYGWSYLFHGLYRIPKSVQGCRWQTWTSL